MKSIFSLFLILACLPAFSQSKSEVKEIDKIVKKTRTESGNYHISHLSGKNEDGEISVFQDYFCNIKLIQETYFNETGKTHISTYFGNNHPVFIMKKYYTYKYPITDKNHDADDFTKSEESFYLKNERVIKWMKGKSKVKKYPRNAATLENNMIEHIDDIVVRFQQQFPY